MNHEMKDKEHNIKISIITVVYNGKDTLAQTIESVISQDYANIEYIIIDGNSTDGTQGIIKEYGHRISYWMSEPDRGIYDAMNKGIEYASGDVIAFINSGDTYEDNILSEVVKDFKTETENIDILICGVNITRKGKFVARRVADIKRVEQKIVMEMPCCHQGIFAKSKWLKGKYNFNIKYKIAADYDWLLKCYYEGAKIKCANIVVANYDIEGFSARNQRVLVEELKDCSLDRLSKTFLMEDEKCRIRSNILKTYVAKKEIITINECLENKDFDWEHSLQFKKNADYSIFGCGLIGEECYRLMERLGVKVVCIWDNDSTKWGRHFMGKEICNPQNIVQDKSIIIIASTLYEEQIEQQLKEQFGRKREQYILYKEFRHEIGQKLIKELHLEETKEKC